MQGFKYQDKDFKLWLWPDGQPMQCSDDGKYGRNVVSLKPLTPHDSVPE